MPIIEAGFLRNMSKSKNTASLESEKGRKNLKTRIINGIIVDGTGKKPYRADIVIQDRMITEVQLFPQSGRSGSTGSVDTADECVIDARGDYVTPGFIDVHSHADLANFWSEGLRPKIMQGVTTEVVGQCGLGVAPLPVAHQSGWRRNLVIGNPPVDWTWETLGEYLAQLEEHGLESNLLTYLPHGVLRYAIKQDAPDPLTDQELEEMATLMEAALTEGAFGVSLGLIYLPAVFADRREFRRVLEVAGRNRVKVAVHLRNESDELVMAIREMHALTEEAGCQLHIAHLKAIGGNNAGQIDIALELIHDQHLTFDHYPYSAGSTTLLAILPPFILAGGVEAGLQRLQIPEVRARLQRIFAGEERVPTGLPWDNVAYHCGWEQISIADLQSEANRQLLGLTLTEVAELRGTTPAEAALDLLSEEQGNVRMIDRFMSEATLRKILTAPEGLIGTDALFGGKPHPRIAGTYPGLLRQYVFERPILSLEAAIAKMTGRVAEHLGLRDRGRIAIGCHADIAIFGRDFTERATYADPLREAVGLRYLLINGQVKVDAGLYVEKRPGMVLRRS